MKIDHTRFYSTENAESFKGANFTKEERYSTSYVVHSAEQLMLQLTKQ